MMPLDLLDPFTREFWIPVLAAIVCGGIVGLERQLRGKPSGMRTCILVCLGTHFFVLLGTALEGGDPGRVLSQVVSGVGFLGAGVILTRDGLLVGVTSAAVIWLLAAIGAGIGLGYITAAVAMAIITVAILVGVEALEKSSLALRQGVHEWAWNPLARRNGDPPASDE